jgi:histidinol-phosphatase (PHP family)
VQEKISKAFSTEVFNIMLDYHIHTKFCGHASGEMDEYVQAARRQPLREMGFADHLPMLKWAQPGYAMGFETLPEYIRLVQHLQCQYPDFPIKLGIEADYYSPDEEQATKDLLAQYPFDYVYGSVHFLDGWAIDDPRYMQKWEEQDVNRVYEQYFTVLQQAIRSGIFDIIAHFDLPKKFGYKPTRDLSGPIERTVKCCQECGVAVEINTAGLRKPVKEMYPAPQILRLLKHYEVPIVLGSDAHRPAEVGQDFELARTVAEGFGYTAVAVFEQRKIVGAYPL